MRIAVLGSSRGLGRAFIKVGNDLFPGAEVLAVARKRELLEEVAAESSNLSVEVLQADFASSEGQNKTLAALKEFRPERIFYFAGGGPFGAFGAKGWKDHQWAFEVSFLFPARLVHEVLQWPEDRRPHQLVWIGSAIAEEKADPMGTSYAASKHALLGLHRSLTAEGSSIDLRLFSPTYMDTEMLPSNSYPRRMGLKLVSPEDAARALWDWAQSGVKNSHFQYL